ncbi:MAG: hypothetical protein LH461_06710, partial [Spirochaetaceae bacterium]|nr:hypothetical protein [Spirochaetaceae bacterium]
MQATVSRFGAATRSGTVLLDDGVGPPYDSDASEAAGIRLLRLGQRVRIEVAQASAGRGVVFLTIATLPDPRQQKA